MMKKLLIVVWRVMKKVILTFFITSISSVILFRFVPVPITPLMLIRCVEQKIDGGKMKLNKKWVPREQLSDHLELAVFCSEDQNFMHHFGIDFKAVERAMEHNEKNKRIHGASTITQQTAKNVFLWPGRSWIRKGFEVYFTFLIEIFWSKERIMEVYLNVIETGNGIYGAESAATAYFKKHAKQLSKAEAALIAAILPNPRKWSPVKPTSYLLKRQQWILQQMALWGGTINYETTDAEKNTYKK